MSPETVLFGIMLAGLTLYALLGGADFGAGVWEFNTGLRASEEERTLLYGAIGPVWEANHVWLIFVIAGMFSAFPAAFEALCRALWVPLLLALVGIVFRGVGFAFRSHAAGAVRQQAFWGAVFAFASTAAPFFLGAAAGAIASGQLNVRADGSYHGDVLVGWINPLSIFVAFFNVGICAYITSIFLTRESHVQKSKDLTALWRKRAIGTGIWMGVLAMTGIAIVAKFAPHLWPGFKERAWPMVGASMLAGMGSLLALWRRRYTTAVIGGVVTIATIPLGWGLAQYPDIVPMKISMEQAKGPDSVLHAMIVVIAIGALFLIPALGFLFYLFKGKRPDEVSVSE